MKTKNNSIVKAADLSAAQFTTNDVINQISQIQELMRLAMKEGEHFGKIPGCGDKLVLLKPGAEKLAFMFRLAPTYEIKIREHEKGHREYEVITTLTHIATNSVIAQGVGICSTLESKFRYRYVDSPYKPQKAEAEKLKIEGKGKWRKSGNDWIWQDKIEFQDVSDNYNTVLKMAKKRSLVDAILTATAASDIFTQDLEDFVIEEEQTEVKLDLNAKSKTTQVERNYTEEINSITSLDELKDYYSSLTEKEQKNLMHLFKQRKQEILSM
jgi:hypothetical protein